MRKKIQIRRFSLLQIVMIIVVITGSLIVPGSYRVAPASETGLTVPSLTDSEKKWIKAHPIIRVAGPKSFPPFYFMQEGIHPSGISVDYLKAVLNSVGLKPEFITGLAWPMVLKKAQDKEIDLIACAAKTKDRTTYLNFSESYLSFPLVIISRKTEAFIGGIEDLNGKKLALIRRNSTEEWLRKDRVDVIAHYVETPLSGLKDVSFGKADAQIENLAAAGYLIQKHGLANLKVAAPTPYGNYDLHMAIRKDFPELQSIIDKALSTITPARRTGIKNRWLSVRYEHGIKPSDIFKWAVPLFLLSAGILAVVLVWNRTLKKESLSRKRVEEKLRASELKYKLLFKNAPAGMYEIDFSTGRFISVNEVMSHYTGYTEEELLQMQAMSLLTPESREKLIERHGHINQGEEFLDAVEYTITRKDGSHLSVILNGDYVFSGGQLVSAHVVAHDITGLKKAEKDKIEAQKIAGEHEKLALVGKIAGKMAHDFNNILGIIMGNTELALIDSREPETRESLELILEHTQRGRNLTKNLLAFARDQEPRQVFFNLHEKIDLVLGLLKKDMKGIDLVRRYKPGMPELLADPGMIEHAMVNLVQNSIHAVSRSDNPRIEIRTRFSGDKAYIEIEDNGCGIPEEYIDKIYEPAFSLKGSRDVSGAYEEGIKGTGYGMSNIKKYIEQHKGSVGVESEAGCGSKFTITLPVTGKELTPEEKHQVREMKTAVGKNILLVEDEPDISDVQCRVLSQEPCCHKVDVARDAESAIELLKKKSYDFISLDYMLPGNCSGMDVYLHARQKNKTIPILFISGNFTFIESIKTLKQKDDHLDHLSKPCRNKDYIDTISNLIEKSGP